MQCLKVSTWVEGLSMFQKGVPKALNSVLILLRCYQAYSAKRQLDEFHLICIVEDPDKNGLIFMFIINIRKFGDFTF